MKKAYSFAHFERFCVHAHANGERHIGQMYRRYVTLHPAFEEDLARDMIGNKQMFAAMLERLNDRLDPPSMEKRDHHRDDAPAARWLDRYQAEQPSSNHDRDLF